MEGKGWNRSERLVNLFSVLVVIGCVVGAAGMVLQVIHSVSVGESIVKMLLSVLMLIAIFSSAYGIL